MPSNPPPKESAQPKGQGKSAPHKSEVKKTKQAGFIARNSGLMAWLIVNIIWFGFTFAPAPHPINAPDHEFRSEYGFEVPPLPSWNPSVEIEVTCAFPSFDGGTTAVGWRITTDSGDEVASWSGRAGEDCPSERINLESGDYIFHTDVEDWRYAEIPDVWMNVHYYKALLWEGFFLANLFGGILFMTDKQLKVMKEKRRLRREMNLPLHKRMHRDEWRVMMHEMDDDDDEVAELSQFEHLVSDGDELLDKERERMMSEWHNKPVLSEEAMPESTPSLKPAPSLEHSAGSEKGLRGALKKDERIEKVGDIWELMRKSQK